LETKQTDGMLVNYNGPNDGVVPLSQSNFPECPYGYMTWVNTDGDLFPGADTNWAMGWGAGGHVIYWNSANGMVFAGFNANFSPPMSDDVPQRIEANITGPNPLIDEENTAPVANSDSVATIPETAVDIILTYTDEDGPGPYTVSIVNQPTDGDLTGSSTSWTYTPDTSFQGTDFFTWKVNDSSLDSNIATVSINGTTTWPTMSMVKYGGASSAR